MIPWYGWGLLTLGSLFFLLFFWPVAVRIGFLYSSAQKQVIIRWWKWRLWHWSDPFEEEASFSPQEETSVSSEESSSNLPEVEQPIDVVEEPSSVAEIKPASPEPDIKPSDEDSFASQPSPEPVTSVHAPEPQKEFSSPLPAPISKVPAQEEDVVEAEEKVSWWIRTWGDSRAWVATGLDAQTEKWILHFVWNSVCRLLGIFRVVMPVLRVEAAFDNPAYMGMAYGFWAQFHSLLHLKGKWEWLPVWSGESSLRAEGSVVISLSLARCCRFLFLELFALVWLLVRILWVYRSMHQLNGMNRLSWWRKWILKKLEKEWLNDQEKNP